MTEIEIETFQPKGKRVSKAEREALAAHGVKWCGTCRSVKPLDAFSANRAKADGLNTCCRECANAKSRRYHYANRDQQLERVRRYRSENLEACREACREASRRWRLENPEKRKENSRRWQRENREQYLAYKRERNAKLRVIQNRLSAALKHFDGRRGWTDRIAARVLKAPDGNHLMYMSDTIEDACARYVGDLD